MRTKLPFAECRAEAGKGSLRSYMYCAANGGLEVETVFGIDQLFPGSSGRGAKPSPKTGIKTFSILRAEFYGCDRSVRRGHFRACFRATAAFGFCVCDDTISTATAILAKFAQPQPLQGENSKYQEMRPATFRRQGDADFPDAGLIVTLFIRQSR